MGYKGIVDLEYSRATFATHQAGKAIGLSASSAIGGQELARSSVRMHSVRALTILHPSYQVKFIGHIYLSWSA